MTVTELQSNESLRRREFPIVRDQAFLAHAAVAPLPHRVAEAIREYALACATADQESLFPGAHLEQTRDLAARLLNAKSEEIALVGPTSLALSFVAAGLPAEPGDNVVIYKEDYPSNVYPWMAMEDRGVQVRWLETNAFGVIELADVLKTIDNRTRCVALASCHFITGARIDVNAIGAALRERGILFCVDAIQTAGAFPTPVDHVDFLAADAHKWLLGPCAAGILYVRKSSQSLLRPAVQGWHNLQCPNFVAQDRLIYRDDARRYEAGTANFLGLAGLRAALELLLELGPDPIADQLLHAREWWIPKLQALGCAVLAAEIPRERASGIVTFTHPATDASILHKKLAEAQIVTSLRTDRSGRRYIRLSPHFYNTDEEFERALECLK